MPGPEKINFESVVVLCGGGSSSEREISLLSGENVYQICRQIFPTEKIILDEDSLPDRVRKAKNSIIFPMTLGEFGEDGGLQTLLEEAGLAFVGSDSQASALCMNKFLAKQIVSGRGVPVADGIKFSGRNLPSIDAIASSIGTNLFIKPNAKGSSLGTHVISSREDLASALENINDGGEYILEKRISGIDLTVAVLDGKALEVVEILPKHGFLDYDNKYVPGRSDKICPAKISASAAKEIKSCGELIFECCKCRDWARMDFILQNNGSLFFLETNTIPGMTQSSFFPLSAAAAGINLPALAKKLVGLAAARMRRTFSE
ncbi:MAG: D-alanine--D-alanine ligase [Puniceicoccales bacterium]|jgi:D-alanine-D-alanine ligase|nr:D-alanine--D-alanine ligase [Puniceicoccales bacterium]